MRKLFEGSTVFRTRFIPGDKLFAEAAGSCGSGRYNATQSAMYSVERLLH